MAVNYRQQAEEQLNPKYNTDITGLKNTLAQNLLAQEQSKAGINTNFDGQVKNQNLSNIKNQNNFSNTMLGRGLSQSSIVGTGIGELGQINQRLVGDINNERTGKLNQIDAQKALLETNTNNQINTINADKENSILTLARQLENEAWDRNYKERQLSLQRTNSGGGGSKPKAPSYSSKQNNADLMEVLNSSYNPLDKLPILREMANEFEKNGDKANADLARAKFAELNKSKETGVARYDDKLTKLYNKERF
jgi:hypothetical protein